MTYPETPRIIRETSNGFYFYDIQDEMLLHREIECLGEITAASVNAIISQVRYLAREAPGEQITIFSNSPGGEVSSGLALYDVLRAVHCPIRTVCVGDAASMAALLFASGDVREMLPHARVMIHDPLTPGLAGSALKIKDAADRILKVRELTASILAKHSGHTLEEIYEKTCVDTWFEAEEAVSFGLADRVIDSL